MPHPSTMIRGLESFGEGTPPWGHLPRNLVKFAGLLLLTWGLLGGASDLQALSDGANQVACAPEASPGRLTCIEADGTVRWERIHPSLWGDQWSADTDETFRERSDAQHTPDVAVANARIFYTVGPDVIEVDPEEGKITDRARFPAPIATLEAGKDDTLLIELELEDAIEVPAPMGSDARSMTSETSLPDTFQLRRSPDELRSPPQTFWTLERRFDVMKDAERWGRALVPAFPDVDDLSQARADRLISRFERARRRDSTNPFYSEMIGRVHRIRGQSEAARRAFERAAKTEEAVWEDLIRLSGRMSKAGVSEEITQMAYERGMAKIQTMGLTPERIQSPLVTSAMLLWPGGDKHPVHRSIDDNEPERAHRYSRQLARLAPFIEGGAPAWSALADWLEQRGRVDVAEEWHDRAERNRHMREGYLRDTLEELDPLMLAVAASLIALVLICFVAGIRGGRIRRRERAASESDRDGRTSFLHVRRRDLLGIAWMALLAVGLSYSCQVRIDLLTTHLLPVTHELAGDSLAAPQSEAWLDAIADSPAQRTLLDTARSEQRALETGESFPDITEREQSTVQLLIDAMRTDAQQRPLRRLQHGTAPFYIPRFESEPFSDELNIEVTPIGMLPLLTLLIVLAVAIVTGAAAGYLAPERWSTWCLRVVPGGTTNIAPFGGFVMMVVIAGLLTWLGLGTYIHRTALPSMHSYFGVSTIASDPDPPSMLGLWIGVAAALVAHTAAAYSEAN